PGMVFSIDGTARPSGMWGVQLPIDPGEHQVEVKAPGYQVWSTVATVPPEQTLTVTIPALTPQPASEAAVAAAPSTGPRATEPAPEAPVNSALQRSDAPAHRSTLTKALAFSLGGAGIAALAVATGFGVRAIHKNNDAKDFCPADGGNGCTQRGLDLTDDSRSAARLSTGLTVAGALLAVGGVAIYFYHPWEKAPRVALKSDGRSASLLLGGAF
ncbi:MAG: hypothetical protein JWN48_3433, partial [Myxococcaceae bacterium]|nr:hypothetical protein [Myxococcaceae bacterium]